MTPPSDWIVLDTNVVLDRWVFDDPASRRLATALAGGRARWITTGPMLSELADVLQRPLAARWESSRERALTFDFEALAQVVVAPPTLLASALRCTDPDDQKFVDLAIQRRIPWLLTHDRALLKLARAASGHGVVIAPPGAWHD